MRSARFGGPLFSLCWRADRRPDFFFGKKKCLARRVFVDRGPTIRRPFEIKKRNGARAERKTRPFRLPLGSPVLPTKGRTPLVFFFQTHLCSFSFWACAPFFFPCVSESFLAWCLASERLYLSDSTAVGTRVDGGNDCISSMTNLLFGVSGIFSKEKGSRREEKEEREKNREKERKEREKKRQGILEGIEVGRLGAACRRKTLGRLDKGRDIKTRHQRTDEHSHPLPAAAQHAQMFDREKIRQTR